MKERALLFGEAKSLVGVVTEAASPSGEPLAVVLLNAGILHHVGPNRLSVQLARRLAKDGVAAMRFDFSGIGDSPARAVPVPFVEGVVAETRAAMDVLAARGIHRFVLFGICSGADNALHAALADERVVGAVLVEPYTIPTSGALVHSYRRKLLNPRSWLRLLLGRSELWSILKRRLTAETPPVRPIPEVREEPASPPSLVPSREEWRRQVQAVVDRGVRLLFVYTPESPALFNYRTSLAPVLGAAEAAGRTRLVLLQGTDHAFTPRAAQEELLALVTGWTRDLRGAASGRERSA